MEDIKTYKVGDIMYIINEKREDYIQKNGEFPKYIEISNSLLYFLSSYYLCELNRDKNNKFFGMKVLINNYIDSPEEIRVY